jgi:hypothetical protein
LAILLGDGTTQVTAPCQASGLIDRLRTARITLTYDPGPASSTSRTTGGLPMLRCPTPPSRLVKIFSSALGLLTGSLKPACP